MKRELSNILKLEIFYPDVFEDYRGQYVETWNSRTYQCSGPWLEWKQDDFSFSSKGVLRGLHGDLQTYKLVQCISGKILLTVFDCRKDSSTYLFHEQFTLTEYNRKQILIPSGCANGHICLSDNCIFHYKQSEFYNPSEQFTIKWNSFGIKWPIDNPILSERDSEGPFLEIKI